MTPPPTAAGAARVRAGAAVPAPLRLPPAPRRVSGPARRAAAAEHKPSGLAAVLLHLVDHPWLERLIRGRAWIAIVAVALLGIVAMQVALLRVGAQIGGQTAAVNSMLQRNETMEATIGGLEASRGVGSSASSLGMLYPPPGAVTYLQLNPGDGQLAADRIESPSAVALAAAAAHPLRTVTHVAATTAASTTGATGGIASTGATGGAAAGTGVVSTSGTATTSGTTSSTATAATAGTGTTTANTPSASNGSAVTAPPTSTSTSPGAPATTVTGGTIAPSSGAGGAATGG